MHSLLPDCPRLRISACTMSNTSGSMIAGWLFSTYSRSWTRMATDFFLIRAIFAFAGFVSALKSMPIHHTAGELSRPFGLAPSTASAKAAEIRKRVRLPPLDAPWPLPELIEDNPALWTFSLNGFIVDARNLPQEIQQEAAKRGLIPYVPPLKGLDAPKEDSDTPDPLQQNLPPRNSCSTNTSHPPQTPIHLPIPMISRLSTTVFGRSDQTDITRTPIISKAALR